MLKALKNILDVTYDIEEDHFHGEDKSILFMKYENFHYDGPIDVLVEKWTFDSDNHFKQFLKKFPHVRNIEFRECVFYGDFTKKSIFKGCKDLDGFYIDSSSRTKD